MAQSIGSAKTPGIEDGVKMATSESSEVSMKSVSKKARLSQFSIMKRSSQFIMAA